MPHAHLMRLRSKRKRVRIDLTKNCVRLIPRRKRVRNGPTVAARWRCQRCLAKRRDRVDARADRTTAYRVDIGPTDGVRILVAGHPGQGGHPRVITATMATNASFRDVIVGRVDLQQLGNATDSF